MVNEVNKLILNTLVEQGAVYIPNIGTLSIYRTASRKRGSKISAPSYSVTFTTECKATSLSSVIMSVANVDEPSADDIVERWHKKLNADGRVVIEGVGTIANGYFSPDSEFIAKLNRYNEPIRLNGNTGNNKRLWLIPLMVVAIVALGLNLYLIFTNREPKAPSTLVADTSTNTLAPENITTENKEVIEDSKTTEVSTDEITSEPVIEQEEEATQATALAEEPVEPVESEEIKEPVEEQKIEEAKVEQPVVEITDWRQLGARHYVIFGSYSNTTNANTAIRKILRRNPAAQCQIIRIGSLHGVAVYGSYNRKDCEVFKRQHRSLYKDAWIHSPRR